MSKDKSKDKDRSKDKERKDKKPGEGKPSGKPGAPAPPKVDPRKPIPRAMRQQVAPEPQKKVVNDYLGDIDLPSSESDSEEEVDRRRGPAEQQEALEDAVRVRAR